MNTEETIDILSYVPEVKENLKEIKREIDTLHKLGQMDHFYERSILLSMDEKWGVEPFIEKIRDVLLMNYESPEEGILVKKVEIPKERSIDYWEERITTIEGLAKRAAAVEAFSIALCDIRDRITEISDSAFLNAIETIATRAKNVLLIFWVPYMTIKERKKIEEQLSTAISFRSIAIPPISVEKKLEYMQKVMEQKQFVLKKKSKDILMHWMYQKQEDGSIKGFHTLDNMCNDIIYYKIMLDNCEATDSDAVHYIEPKDIEGLFQQSEKEENAYDLLNELIGMAELKQKVREIVAQIKLQKELRAQGKNIETPSLHMMFLGNPGTGKTTLARIIGKIFKQEGLLRVGNFIETTGNYYVEGLVSDTVKKVRSTCKSAYGSVLFIDEAYGMAAGHSNGNTADIVIPVFVAEMENHREDMCVIFAGYEDEMEAFLKTNSGLKSRVPHVFQFKNYSKEELQEIFFHMVKGSFEYESELEEILKDYLENISEEAYESKEFSNARFVRNLYERVWGKTAYRVNFSEDKEIKLKKEDLKEALGEEQFASMIGEKIENKIGFVTS